MNDTASLKMLNEGDEMAFEQVFKSHFKALHAYAFTMVRDDSTAEEMVQNVFCRLWEKSGQLDIQLSVNAYLYRSVYHECLNYLKHNKVKAGYQAYAMNQTGREAGHAAGKLLLGELEEKLHKALNELPEQCRTIFQMSRFDELKYREIAFQLGISVKTVENQMGKALKILRLKLVDFLPLILFLLFNR